MNDPKNFLERWSRRKLESETPDAAPADKAAPPSVEERACDSAAPAKTALIPEIDPATLPSIESIVAGTDIRAFLQKGVSAALTRAALRRAWSADPAVRDFIGLSENSWDFPASDSIHGFGPLDPAEGRSLVAQFFGDPDETATAGHSATDRNSLVQTTSVPEESLDAGSHEMRDSAPREPENTPPAQVQDAKKSDKNADAIGSDEQPKIDVATQYHEQNDEYDSVSLRPRHGGALPK